MGFAEDRETDLDWAAWLSQASARYEIAVAGRRQDVRNDADADAAAVDGQNELVERASENPFPKRPRRRLKKKTTEIEHPLKPACAKQRVRHPRQQRQHWSMAKGLGM